MNEIVFIGELDSAKMEKALAAILSAQVEADVMVQVAKKEGQK